MPAIGIGKGCVIKRAIIDKNARIGEDVRIINPKRLNSFESDMYSIKDGIVVIPKNTSLAPGTLI